MRCENQVQKIYDALLRAHGPQGWWPLLSEPKKYHPENFELPTLSSHIFEIAVGAILTQNTAWTQVEKALHALKEKNALESPQALLKLSEEELKRAIRPAGYFNQKAKKLRIFSEFHLDSKAPPPTRESLLSLWGIGPETADSILLYAYKVPIFVVDAYTKRIFTALQLISPTAGYSEVQNLFHASLKPDFKIFQEYHALIVEHAKRYYSKKPYGAHCPLKSSKF